MNWFHKIFKFAKPKDKVIKYKITDNILINFINKYENLVPWQTIKDSNDLQKFIKDHLLNSLYDKIDATHPNNNYLKNIDIEKEFKQNPNDPQIQQAYQIYQKDPQKAKEFLLSSINKNKSNDFTDWWMYLNQDNDTYKENPAFIFQLFKPIIDSSGPTVKASIPSLNANTVAKIYEGLSKEIFDGNLLKAYQKQLAIDNVQTSQYVPTDNNSGWIRIPSQANDNRHFAQNVDKLKNFSIPNKWCTGSGLAEPYLKQGDFWLYLQDGVAKIAIRFVGNNIEEIRGYNNQPDYKFRREIINFVESNKFNIGYNRQYKLYKQALEINKQIKESDDPNATAKDFINEANDYDELIKNIYIIDKELITPEIKELIKKKVAIFINSKDIILDYKELLSFFHPKEIADLFNQYFKQDSIYIPERVDIIDRLVSSNITDLLTNTVTRNLIHDALDKSLEHKKEGNSIHFFNHYVQNGKSPIIDYVKSNFPDLSKKLESAFLERVNAYAHHGDFLNLTEKINDSPEYIKSVISRLNFENLLEEYKQYKILEDDPSNPYLKKDTTSKHINSDYILRVIKNKIFQNKNELNQEIPPNAIGNKDISALIKQYMYENPSANFYFMQECIYNNYNNSNERNHKDCYKVFSDWFEHFYQTNPALMSKFNVAMAYKLGFINQNEANEIILNHIQSHIEDQNDQYGMSTSTIPDKLFENKKFVDKFIEQYPSYAFGVNFTKGYYDKIVKNFGEKYILDWAAVIAEEILQKENNTSYKKAQQLNRIFNNLPSILHYPRVQSAIADYITASGAIPLDSHFIANHPNESIIFKNLYKKYIINQNFITSTYQIDLLNKLGLSQDPEIKKLLIEGIKRNQQVPF